MAYRVLHKRVGMTTDARRVETERTKPKDTTILAWVLVALADAVKVVAQML